jgi:hypothetical protein
MSSRIRFIGIDFSFGVITPVERCRLSPSLSRLDNESG